MGLSVTFMTIGEGFKLARHIKSKDPRALIVFGGPQATLMPEESIACENVDVVVLGEGEFTMLEVVNAWEEGKAFEGIRGLWYKDDRGEVRRNERRGLLKDLDEQAISDISFFTDTRQAERLLNGTL